MTKALTGVYKTALVAEFTQACNAAWWLQLGTGALLVAAWVVKKGI